MRAQPNTLSFGALLRQHRLAAQLTQEDLVVRRVERFRAQNHRRALTLWLRVHAVVLCRQGQPDKAERAFTEAKRIAQAIRYPHAEGRCLEEHGLVRARRGERELAREHLDAAVTIFRRLGARSDLERTAQALHDLR